MDSFDSQDPSYSSLGRYDPNPLKPKDNGDVAVNLGVVDTLSIGIANTREVWRRDPGEVFRSVPTGKSETKPGWQMRAKQGFSQVDPAMT